jgi:1-acyl-sn-glycerol-3-phosphate acyltransferase
MSAVVSILMWMAGLSWLFLVCVTFLIASLFIPARNFDPSLKKMLRGLFKLLFIPVRVEGTEKIDPRKTYLYMANHASLFDAPLLGGFIPGMVRGVEAKQHFGWPLYGLFLRRAGNIPIDQRNVFKAARSLNKTERRLSKGLSFIILPEGHRTLDGNLQPFKRLPFRMAQQAAIDIVPVGLSGLFELMRRGSWKIRRVPVKIRFGDPIPADVVRSFTPDALRDIVRARITGLTAPSTRFPGSRACPTPRFLLY